jgi:5'-nucleotidase
MIGASPLVSALFHDEPSIEAFNLIGLDFNAVGNHEFDEGVDELQRMQSGGCHPVDGCLDGDGFAGASFQYLAANVVYKKNGKTIFPAYKIRSYGGAKIAFIGLTLEGTPSLVTQSGIASVDFKDEAETVNALVPAIKAQGVKTIVVLIHEGGLQSGFYNDCNGISGAIVEIVNNLDDEVDAVISGHTHAAYNCVIDDKLVTSASSFGRLITDIDLTIDRSTDQVTSKSASNVIVTRTVAKDPAETLLLDKYLTLSAPLANRVVGSITANIGRAETPAGETPLGDVIADAQVAAMRTAGAVVAFMNPGGIRSDLTYAGSTAGEGDGNVTYGELFAVQPFGNTMMTMTLTGAQIRAALEQQFPGCNGQTIRKVLQVSAGFSYSWSQSGAPCAKVDPSSLRIDGIPVDPLSSYRVALNNFLAGGGDGFTTFQAGTDITGGGVDIDALSNYLAANSPVPPGPADRITVLP